MGVKLESRGGGRGRRRAHRMMSEINVTPLVDVMLVLLVVFMVTAPLLTAGVNIDLPKAKAKSIHQQDDKPLEIALDAQGQIHVGQTAVTADRLSGMLQAIAREAPDRRVYVRADSHLSYGQVMTIMGIASSAGFSKIALITDPASASQ